MNLQITKPEKGKMESFNCGNWSRVNECWNMFRSAQLRMIERLDNELEKRSIWPDGLVNDEISAPLYAIWPITNNDIDKTSFRRHDPVFFSSRIAKLLSSYGRGQISIINWEKWALTGDEKKTAISQAQKALVWTPTTHTASDGFTSLLRFTLALRNGKIEGRARAIYHPKMGYNIRV